MQSEKKYSTRHPADRSLVDLHNDRTFRHDRWVRADMRSVFLNPLTGNFQARITAGLVRANRDRSTPVTRIEQCVAYEARYCAQGRFDVDAAFFHKLE